MQLSPFLPCIALILLISCGDLKTQKRNTTDESSRQSDAIMAAGRSLSKNGIFAAKVEWLTGPIAEDYSKARLTFLTPTNRAPDTVSDIQFTPFMPSMGHGTLVKEQKITAEAGSPNIFQVDKIYFVMGGPWEIRLTATVDGRKDLAVIPVKVP